MLKKQKAQKNRREKIEIDKWSKNNERNIPRIEEQECSQ